MSRPDSGLQKYFVALIPPSPYYEEALSWKHFFQDNFHTKAALRSPPHITLQMPFRWKEEEEPTLFESLASFAAAQTPFNIAMQGFGAFAPRVIYLRVVPSESLLQLAADLQRMGREQLQIAVSLNTGLPFHPHLTVAFRDLKRNDFNNAWNEVKDKPWQAQWRVAGITLLKHDGKVWHRYHDFAF